MGKRIQMKLTANKNYLDRYVWKCPNRSCRGIENIRKGNKLFESFSKIKFKIILVFVFTHFTAMISPKLSQQILGLNLTSIRRINDYLSSCIIKDQIEEENDLDSLEESAKLLKWMKAVSTKEK